MKTLESDNEATDFSRSLSRCFSGIDSIGGDEKAEEIVDEGQPKDGSAAARQRFSWAEKIQIFQAQISKLKREMIDQQNEIVLYTRELHRRKEIIDNLMENTTSYFRKNNQKGVDAQRFYQIAKGLHAATTFEQTDSFHRFD